MEWGNFKTFLKHHFIIHPVYPTYQCSIPVHVCSLLLLLKLVSTLSTPSLLEFVWSFLWDTAYTWGLNLTFQYCALGDHACTVLFILFWLAKVCHYFSWWRCFTPLYAPMGIALGLLYLGRGVTIEPNILWSTPFPVQEFTLGVTLREFPWMLK